MLLGSFQGAIEAAGRVMVGNGQETDTLAGGVIYKLFWRENSVGYRSVAVKVYVHGLVQKLVHALNGRGLPC